MTSKIFMIQKSMKMVPAAIMISNLIWILPFLKDLNFQI